MADARPICVGIKADGMRCDKRITEGQTRCSIHLRTLQTHGPHATALKELKATQKHQYIQLDNQWHIRIQAEQNQDEKNRLHDRADFELADLKAQQRRAVNRLMFEQQEEIHRIGVDPDAEARRVRAQRQQQQREAVQARIDRFRLERRLLREAQEAVERVVANENAQQVARPGAAAHLNGELGRFARDAQNIHTTVAVTQTKDMVDRILKISVPEEYRWNTQTCSKTPGDIIMNCRLTPKGAWQMSAKYCQDESIYDLGKGIYGKVLDGVWQYVLNSSDKADLCRILKQEMEDNIGMCAQGNLTRLCNILAGYMEGIGAQESPAEVLGRKLPLLMEIEDEAERITAAYKLFVEVGIPEHQWLSWVEPLVESGTARLKANGAGQVIGIEVV
jgi:hypothetical protein